jgi:hypothetical protein
LTGTDVSERWPLEKGRFENLLMTALRLWRKSKIGQDFDGALDMFPAIERSRQFMPSRLNSTKRLAETKSGAGLKEIFEIVVRPRFEVRQEKLMMSSG